ncbi:polysaccharide biosynthesis tyrosine autokinase [Ornithinimicrobium sp. Y1847]|uniref:polysaccharide biosynthesis tyrosine autokinase n=1 Tax=Ornithinimicrobium sp. Y1847 TaxID=3405419 RepID=UPI003B671016
MTLQDALRIFRANWRGIVAGLLLGLCAASLFTMTRPVVYQATSTAYVVAGDSGTMGDAFSGASLAKERAAAYVPLVNSLNLARRVVDDLGLERSPQSVTGALSGSVVPDSYVFRITASADSPQAAKDLADAGIRALVDEAFALENAGRPEGQEQSSVIKVVPVEEALLPGAPVSPNLTQNLAVGAAVGLAAGIALALARRHLDRRVRSKTDVTESLGAPVLGVLPGTRELDRRSRKGGSIVEQGAAAEALRTLRTNLKYANLDNPPRSILITSASAGEGKSTVSSQLARVMAAAGQLTLLVDADLRRPMVATEFDLDDAVGLTQVLAGEIDLESALQRTGDENLHVLTAGRVPPNPSEVVGSQRMHTFLDRVVADGYFVIIDAPPLLPVTDAGLLSTIADGTLLIVSVGQADKDQMGLSLEVLERVNGHLLGAVLNRAPLKGMGSVVYGYGYRTRKQDHYATSTYAKAGKAPRKRRAHPKR